MSLLTKQHIALLLFDDDERKSPLSNERTDVLEWYNALGIQGQQRMLSDHGLERNQLDWTVLTFVYQQVHSKYTYEGKKRN